MGIGRFTPPYVGLPLTKLIARRMASQKEDPMIQAVRANQWFVSGGTLSSEELDQAVIEVFEHQARCIYTLYHNFTNPKRLADMMVVTPEFQQVIDDSNSGRRSMILAGMHISNFDMVLYGASEIGLKAYVLGVSDPTGGYKQQYEMRSKNGMVVVPSSKETLREAEKRLRDGEIVITGADRALPGSRYAPNFFGKPAPLPAVYVRLGVKTGRPVVVVGAIMNKEGKYVLHASEPIEMKPYEDRKTEIEKNAEKVLAVGEGLVRMAPRQWMMFYPVWPDALREMPN